MADPGDDRIAERVDAAAVAQEVHAERLVVAIERGPERLARLDQPLKDGVGQRPDARARFEDRRAAPSVDDELDVAPRHAFRRRLPIRPQRLEIRALRRDERQRAVVEHHAHDDAADDTAAHADTAAGASTWRSLDPNGETSSSWSQSHAGRSNRVSWCTRAGSARSGSRAVRPRHRARPRTSDDRWPGRCATRRRRRGWGPWSASHRQSRPRDRRATESRRSARALGGPVEAADLPAGSAPAVRTSSRRAAPWPPLACASSDGYIANAGARSARNITKIRAAWDRRRPEPRIRSNAAAHSPWRPARSAAAVSGPSGERTPHRQGHEDPDRPPGAGPSERPSCDVSATAHAAGGPRWRRPR